PSRTFSAGCVFVIATSSTSSADRPDFAAALAICSRTRCRFSAIEFMGNCRAGAPPANSFVSASDALALQSLRASESHYYFAGQSTRNHAKRQIMTRYLLLLVIILAAVTCSGLFAQEKAALQPNATVVSLLQGSAGKSVELHLRSGEKMGGKIVQVTDNIVHLSNLTGAEYFDAFVDVKDISAVVVRVAGR